jgi:hypothetical protein
MAVRAWRSRRKKLGILLSLLRCFWLNIIP